MKNLLSMLLALALCLGLALPAAAYDVGTVGSNTTFFTDRGATAAIDPEGTLWVWGSETAHMNDKWYMNMIPGPKNLMENVASVAAGQSHMAVIKTDGSLWTWGSNAYGQLGQGPVQTKIRHTPGKVMDGVVAVSGGDEFTAAIKADGSLWTWGNNNYGQLGNGTLEPAYTPVKVMDDVAVVACGESTTAALKTDGSLWMWGVNNAGQLGNGGGSNAEGDWGFACQTVPVKIMDDVASVSCGGQIRAAVKTDGSLWMWGHSEDGLFGDGADGAISNETYNGHPIQTVPVKIMGSDVAAVSCGFNHTAIIKTDGSLWVWGEDRYGQLGLGQNTNGEHIGSTPDLKWPVQTIPVKLMDGVVAVNCGDNNTAVVKRDGSLWMCGTNEHDELGNGWKGNVEVEGFWTAQTVLVRVSLEKVALPTNAVLPSIPTVAGFKDVYENDYYAGAVQWAKETSVTGGTSATTFSPNKTVTRAEAVTFLWRAAGSPQPASAVSPYTDVTDLNAYYYNAVLWATEQGITGGVGNNRFSVDGTLTYDQIMAMLCRAAGETASGSDWSAAAIAWAEENGLTDGLDFSTKDSCPRADVVYCLWKQLAK